MKEDEVVLIARNYVKANRIDAGIVERVTFVDADKLPKNLRREGSFWVVTFSQPEDLDKVVEHDGVVLNIYDLSQEVLVIH